MIDQYATYVIFFHNRDEYTFAIAACGGDPSTGGIYNRCPVAAANAFGIPYPFPSGDMDSIDKGVYYIAPYNPGSQVNPAAPPNIILPDNQDWVDIPGIPASQGWASGEPVRLHWSGFITYMKGANPNDPLNITPIPQRRWANGIELQPTGEGSNSFSTGAGCRDSSRTIDGVGHAVRGNVIGNWNNTLSILTPGYTSNRSWERFYFRIRRLPSVALFQFWRCRGFPSNSAGMALRLTTTGNIELVTISAVGTAVVVGTYPTILDMVTWYKVDIILKFDSSGGGNHGLIQVYLNFVNIFNITGFDMDSNSLHNNSDLGNVLANDPLVEMDFDDWINADWPMNAGALSLDSMDWLMGSHVRRGWNISGSYTGFTPASSIQVTNQGVSPDPNNNGTLTTAVASSPIQVLTDYPLLGVQDKAGEVAVGPVSGSVSARSTNSLNTDGQIGYSIAGGAFVMATSDDTTSPKFNFVGYHPSGLTEPVEITPVQLKYIKSADGATGVVTALSSIMEYIGIWGPEDCIDPSLYPTDKPRINWLHNCRYPNTNYGTAGPTPLSMVYAVGGTYTGNGTQQDIILPGPCHFLHIRALTSGTRGIKFFGAGMGGNYGVTEQVTPNTPIRMYYDATTGTYKFTVAGTGSEINQNAIIYQYIAFCDPGMRFCCTDAYNVPTSVTSRVHNLQNPNFTPEFMMVQKQWIGALSNTLGMWHRGPGSIGTQGNQMNGSVVVNNFGTFGLGTFTSGADSHQSTQSQMTYIAFRSTEPNCGWIGTQCMTYTGNGAGGTRVINLTPVSGRYPLFVLVCATGGSQSPIFRDPSHGGQNSSAWDTINLTITTGITAGGLDTITVGTTLNVNGVVYNVFCIPGSISAAFVNGTYWPPNCDSPDPFYNPVMTPPDMTTMGNGGLTLDGSTTITMLKNISGIYTLVPGKTNDTMYDRQTGQSSVDIKIPDPTAKTGYIGG